MTDASIGHSSVDEAIAPSSMRRLALASMIAVHRWPTRSRACLEAVSLRSSSQRSFASIQIRGRSPIA